MNPEREHEIGVNAAWGAGPNETEPGAALSAAGEARKQRLRGELLHSIGRVHAARRLRRRAVYATAVLALTTTAMYLTLGSPRHPARVPSPPDQTVHAPEAPEQPDPAASAPSSPVRIAIVHDDPTVLERYTRPAPQRVVIIDDDELLRTLREIGRPAGLIEIDGKVRLSRDVTDEGWKPANGPGVGGGIGEGVRG